jgi:hypothetical protein
MSRDSVVGIGIPYGLDDPRIKSRWGARVSTPAQTSPVAYAACCGVSRGSTSRGKAAGGVVNHPPHLAKRVRKQ